MRFAREVTCYRVGWARLRGCGTSEVVEQHRCVQGKCMCQGSALARLFSVNDLC